MFARTESHSKIFFISRISPIAKIEISKEKNVVKFYGDFENWSEIRKLNEGPTGDIEVGARCIQVRDRSSSSQKLKKVIEIIEANYAFEIIKVKTELLALSEKMARIQTQPRLEKKLGTHQDHKLFHKLSANYQSSAPKRNKFVTQDISYKEDISYKADEPEIETIQDELLSSTSPCISEETLIATQTVINSANQELLLKAIWKQDISTVISLLATKEIDINATDICGRTVLEWAVESGNLEITKVLLKHKALANEAALIKAISLAEDIVEVSPEGKLISEIPSKGFDLIRVLIENDALITEKAINLAFKYNACALSVLFEYTHVNSTIKNFKFEGNAQRLKLLPAMKSAAHYRIELATYRKGMQTFNFGLYNKSTSLGLSDDKSQLKNEARPLRIFSNKYKFDHNVIKEISLFLKPR